MYFFGKLIDISKHYIKIRNFTNQITLVFFDNFGLVVFFILIDAFFFSSCKRLPNQTMKFSLTIVYYLQNYFRRLFFSSNRENFKICERSIRENWQLRNAIFSDSHTKIETLKVVSVTFPGVLNVRCVTFVVLQIHVTSYY